MLRFLLFLATITSLSAQATTDTSLKAKGIGESRASVGGRIVSDTFIARSLQGNLLGDDIERKVIVYLPPNYETSPRTRYPAIYLLHGWGDRIDSWINGRFRGLKIKDDMDRLIEAREIREMIVVMPDARNHYGGSYVNSSVTGAWADAIAHDLVGHIDHKYRTITSWHWTGDEDGRPLFGRHEHSLYPVRVGETGSGSAGEAGKAFGQA